MNRRSIVTAAFLVEVKWIPSPTGLSPLALFLQLALLEFTWEGKVEKEATGVYLEGSYLHLHDILLLDVRLSAEMFL